MAQPEQPTIVPVPSAHDTQTPVTPNRPRFASRTGKGPPQPASVKINVQGAFIVNDETINRNGQGQSEYVHWEHKDIRLPHHTDVVSHIAVDIGGSLAKLVYFSREPGSTIGGGRLNFLNFETDRIDECIAFIQGLKENQSQLNGSKPADLCIMATGGGAFRFYDKMRDVLHVDVVREDEMDCLIIGLDFFINEIPREVFTFSEDPEQPQTFIEEFVDSRPEDIYPYLLVNIGSGVSMIKVSGPRQFQRVGGTSLGGGTFWGILSLLTGARTFDEMLAMADRGDNAGVDMLVGDIYGSTFGTSTNITGLKSTTIASTFGKVFKMKRAAERHAEDGAFHNSHARPAIPMIKTNSGTPTATTTTSHPSSTTTSTSAGNSDPTTTLTDPEQFNGFRIEDMSRSLLYAISNNIGQIAYLQSEKHNLQHIYFGGSFIRGHAQTMNTLSYAIKFWSKGEKQAYFLRHEGYLGAVGAFLRRQPKNWGRRNSFEEGMIVRTMSRQ